MCNLAGYVGERPAAEVLLPMMEEQQGFAGGYYSGVATLADGRLHHAKCIGDFARLRAEQDVDDLPGSVGIAHSRSNSGGDVEWGHPFLDCAGRMAYVANGAMGQFDDPINQAAIVRDLAEAGHAFRSASEGDSGYSNPPTLPDGRQVHLSEVMAHLIEWYVDREGGPAAAMRKAYTEYPAEIVGLMVHLDQPDAVIATRINQPLMIGRSDDGVYLATTALAFPKQVQHAWPLPPLTTAVVTRERVELQPLDLPLDWVDPDLPWQRALEWIKEELEGRRPRGLGELQKAIEALWVGKVPFQRDHLTYEILRRLYDDGYLYFDDVWVPGAVDGIIAPRRRVRAIRSDTKSSEA